MKENTNIVFMFLKIISQWLGQIFSTDASVRYAICGLFYLHGLTLIPVWISNYIHYKLWDEITYPFLNFNSCTVEV